ncbi:MAG: UDP-glucose dehydrogenase family protein [Terriglobia bacterium]
MEISVIGAGYVGLTTAACLTELGYHVLCADSDVEKLRLLRNGKLPFFEPHLAEIVHRGAEAGLLQFVSTDEAVGRNEVIFICVGTPPLENGEADLSAVDNVTRTIARQARGYRLVIEKSTVPVKTGRQLQKHLGVYRTGFLEYDVASNPEFLREGSAVEDFFHPDRIVVGIESPKAEAMLREIYRPILDQSFRCPVHQSGCNHRNDVPFLLTDINSAELIKHASNSFLAMKISFINLVSDLCEATGGDINQVAEGIGLDRRIGHSFLRPGIGFGGSCFPKDVKAFVRIAETFGCDFSLLKEAERVNSRRVDLFLEKVKSELWVVRGKTICIWGLAFKPNTDDIRRAPALEIMQRLLAEGAVLQAYDPQAMDKAATQFPDVKYCSDPYKAAQCASAILALTEWEELRRIDLARVRRLVDRPLIFDGRNMFSRHEASAEGFKYVGIGFASEALALEDATAFAS